jgi:hypothetical protein
VGRGMTSPNPNTELLMYIGVGTILVILLIVLIVMMMRRRAI